MTVRSDPVAVLVVDVVVYEVSVCGWSFFAVSLVPYW
ncbi:hypothetical protein SAURM35S_00070 [Streptomyces aurantiogriseus]